MMLSAISLVFHDVGVCGRVSHLSLDDQTLMELLVAQFDGRAAMQGRSGCYLAIREWTGVSLNDAGNVRSVDWTLLIPAYGFFRLEREGSSREMSSGGTIDIQWIPPEVTNFQIAGMQLAGTMCTSGLPRGLRTLNVLSNQLAGFFHVNTLPCTMCYLNIADNRFSGPLDVASLPLNVEEFHARCNAFSGTLNVSTLPLKLKVLSVHTNQFSGEIDLLRIPLALRHFDIHNNRITQEILRVGKPKGTFTLFYYDDEQISNVSFESATDQR